MSYFWLDPRRNVAAAIMTETYWQVDPLGWKGELDDLDQAPLHSLFRDRVLQDSKSDVVTTHLSPIRFKETVPQRSTAQS